jgi:hypothetical protein
VDDHFEVPKDRAHVLDVLANDSDPNGDPLTIISVYKEHPAMGTVEINPDGTVTYTPMANWWGADHFEYTISDPHGATSTATVTLEVTQG